MPTPIMPPCITSHDARGRPLVGRAKAYGVGGAASSCAIPPPFRGRYGVSAPRPGHRGLPRPCRAEKSTTQILHILLRLRACEAEHELGCSSFEIGARLSKAVLGRTGHREGGEE